MTKKLRQILLEATELERSAWGQFWATVNDCSTIIKEDFPIERVKNWAVSARRDLYDKQEGICAGCREEISIFELEVDHIIPFAYGGGNEPANLQLLCRSCNATKGSTVDPIELLKYLEGRYNNRYR